MARRRPTRSNLVHRLVVPGRQAIRRRVPRIRRRSPNLILRQPLVLRRWDRRVS